MQKELKAEARQWMVRGGVLATLAVALTACGGQATTTQPAQSTTAPEATVAAPKETATAVAPEVTVTAATAVAVTEAAAGAASPVAGAAATPAQAQGARATPVGGKLSKDCEAYNAWLQDPQVKSDMEKMSYWPEIIAEGEKAAKGEPVDVAKMQATYDQMAKVAKDLRASSGDDVNHDSVALAGKAMGLASRLAGALATKEIDAAGAATAVTNLNEAIAAYEANVAERQASCGS